MSEPRRTAAAGTGTAPAARTDGGATTGTTATTGTAGTAGTSRDATATGSTAGRTQSEAERGYPDHAVVRMSKADLQNAPTFTYAGETRSDDRSGARSTTAPGGTTAPRQ
jgi:hypothetical protein